ncbi:hypothetical protein B0I35DRAFT_405648 [Stachybotrys elegans]|uniref:Conserved oligomeric Golgi complex subunit 1 n=1 Tax=Stachybotrys elegans TaxID=80388 RepID=A0A8K0T1V3_9HYPO|nr:hypothetical protein B0I35DRAFT_405648 [Stachybotrys elegans]
MASPDITGLTSSAQVFSGKHTLPQIRSIHKALHVQIEDKAARLRTQVGGSYRELLGTADTIVQMRGHNDEVQGLLGRMGGRCGRGIVDVKASALASFVEQEKSPKTTEAARLRILDACALVVTRVLKGGGGLGSSVKRGARLVLAAKVLVLSRLLVKSLGEEMSDETAQRAAESVTKTLGTLRRRLLRGIEKALEKVDEESDREEALQALCAYSLATSSGAKDALRHFLHVRGQAMAYAFDVENEREKKSDDDVVLGLQTYTRTLLDVQALVPTKLSQALNSLKRRPLLEDTAVRQLEGLRLDVYGRWCSEEIQYFTPFIRHDDIDGKQAREMLSTWAKRGEKVMISGLQERLQHMGDFKSIMDLRTRILQLWIRDGGRAKGFDPQEVQDELRDVINQRMLVVLESKVGKLHLVESEVSATLEAWNPGVTDKNASLWAEDGYDTALANGAAPFVQEVVSRLYGRNDAVSKALHCYTSWYQIIDDVKEVVESLRKQRWDNDYDEVEDESTIEERQQLLSRDDPNMLQDRLNTTLDKSFQELDQHLQALWTDRATTAQSSSIAMYLIRVLRDIRDQLPKRQAIESFGLRMVPELHQTIAVQVSASPLEQWKASGLSVRKVAGRPLWEGEPALPSQPSPAFFNYLRSLSLSMTDAGMDLWSPAAVRALKEHSGERLCVMWREALSSASSDLAKAEKSSDEISDKGENATSSTKDAEGVEEARDETGDASADNFTAEKSKDLHIQWFYDISLLQCCYGEASGKARSQLEKLGSDILGKAELDEGAKQRIVKSTEDFWQRTRLLFGLLS